MGVEDHGGEWAPPRSRWLQAGWGQVRGLKALRTSALGVVRAPLVSAWCQDLSATRSRTSESGGGKRVCTHGGVRAQSRRAAYFHPGPAKMPNSLGPRLGPGWHREASHPVRCQRALRARGAALSSASSASQRPSSGWVASFSSRRACFEPVRARGGDAADANHDRACPRRARVWQARVASDQEAGANSRAPVSVCEPGTAVRQSSSAGRQTSAAHEEGPDAASRASRARRCIQVSRAQDAQLHLCDANPRGGSLRGQRRSRFRQGETVSAACPVQSAGRKSAEPVPSGTALDA
jgi:hypothetical protein